MGVHQWSAYHSSANFSSPDAFVPERWLANPPPEYLNDDKAAWQPFSLGPRGCLGKRLVSFFKYSGQVWVNMMVISHVVPHTSLAYLEMRSILARVLWNFDMELDETSQRWMDQKEYTLWDKPSLWVRLKHRAATTHQ